jgi:hypothetical protein
MKIKKSLIVLIVLIVWAAFSVVYIAWNSWQQFKINQAQAAFNNGVNQGYQQAIVDLATEAKKCQEVPLRLGKDESGKDITMGIVATACLQQPDDSAAPAAPSTEKK